MRSVGVLIDTLVANLGVSFPDLIVLLTVLGSVIFFAKDLRLGAVLLFSLLAIEFILFTELGINSFSALIALMVSIVLLSLSLYITRARLGGGIV
jgi:hypothetical protein